jgi:hypothetical protein
LHAESVRLTALDLPEELWVRWLLQQHAQLTSSPIAEELLQSEGPLPLARVEPLQPPCTVADAWQAVIRRTQKSRQFPLDALTEATSPEPTLM